MICGVIVVLKEKSTEKEIGDKALQYIEKLKKKKRESLALKLGEHLLSILEIYKDEVE